jgi:hypothetical protein
MQFASRWSGLDAMRVDVAFGDWLHAVIVPALLKSAGRDEP